MWLCPSAETKGFCESLRVAASFNPFLAVGLAAGVPRQLTAASLSQPAKRPAAKPAVTNAGPISSQLPVPLAPGGWGWLRMSPKLSAASPYSLEREPGRVRWSYTDGLPENHRSGTEACPGKSPPSRSLA
jgi:hypothetical protein